MVPVRPVRSPDGPADLTVLSMIMPCVSAIIRSGALDLARLGFMFLERISAPLAALKTG